MIESHDGSFYKAIQQGVLGYLSDKLDLKTTDLSKNNVQHILTENKIQSALISKTMKLMNDCEMALYGGSDSDNKTLLYENAVHLISGFEEKI